MPAHLQREMEKLNRATLEMCAHVELNVRDATRSFFERDPELAARVIAADRFVDKMEVELSENCLKILDLHQPVAKDLRFIMGLAKIGGILERIGDLAENLARKGKKLAVQEPVAIPPEISEMADSSRRMLKDSIDSLVDSDSEKARTVIIADRDVNRGKRRVRRAAEAAIMAAPETCKQWLTVVAASRNVERMADMAVNIAAEVIYGVEGRVVRHGLETE